MDLERRQFSALPVDLGSVGNFRRCLMGMGWVWVGLPPPCQKGCHRHQQDCVKFFGRGGGQPKVSVGNLGVVEVLEKHFGEWRDV